jgi:hypothetical protein
LLPSLLLASFGPPTPLNNNVGSMNKVQKFRKTIMLEKNLFFQLLLIINVCYQFQQKCEK